MEGARPCPELMHAFNIPVAFSSSRDLYNLLERIFNISLWDLVLVIVVILQVGQGRRKASSRLWWSLSLRSDLHVMAETMFLPAQRPCGHGGVRGEVGSAGQGGGPGAGPLGRVTQAVSLSEGPWCCHAFGACVLHTYCVSGHCSCKDCRELTRTGANPLPAHGWHMDVGPCGGYYYFYYYHYSKEARPVVLAHTIPRCHLGGRDRRPSSRFLQKTLIYQVGALFSTSPFIICIASL